MNVARNPAVDADPYADFVPRPAALAAPVPARTVLERFLVDAWERALDTGPIGIDDDYFVLGGDSISAVAIITALDATYGVKLYPSALLEAPTVRALAARIGAGLQSGEWQESTLVPLRRGDESDALYLVHGAGGEVMFAQHIVDALEHGGAIHGFRNSFPLDAIDEGLAIGDFAARYLDVLLARRPRGPYRLAGYSGGGLIAFDMACRLQRMGHIVASLIVIDMPCLAAAGAWRRWRWRTRDERAARADTGGDMAAMERAIGRAARAYRPAVFAGRLDLVATPEVRRRRPDGGWGRFVDGRVAVAAVEGDHFSILRPPRAAAVARAIDDALAASGQAARDPT